LERERRGKEARRWGGSRGKGGGGEEGYAQIRRVGGDEKGETKGEPG